MAPHRWADARISGPGDRRLYVGIHHSSVFAQGPGPRDSAGRAFAHSRTGAATATATLRTQRGSVDRTAIRLRCRGGGARRARAERKAYEGCRQKGGSELAHRFLADLKQQVTRGVGCGFASVDSKEYLVLQSTCQ